MVVYETKPRIQNIFKHEIRLHPFQSVLKFSSFWKFSKIMKFCTWTCNFSYDFSRASFKFYPCETPVWHKHGSCDSYKGVHVPFLWQIRNLELAFDQRSDSDVASDGRLHLQIKNVFKKSSKVFKYLEDESFSDFFWFWHHDQGQMSRKKINFESLEDRNSIKLKSHDRSFSRFHR